MGSLQETVPFACLSPQCGQPQWPSREQQARQTPCEHAHGPVASRTHISCRLAAVRRGQSHPCACQPNAGCRLAHSKRVLAFSFQSRWHRALRIFPQLLAENCFVLVFNQPLGRFLPPRRHWRCLRHAARLYPWPCARWFLAVLLVKFYCRTVTDAFPGPILI